MDQVNITSDDTQIVDDILNELNSTDQHQNQPNIEMQIEPNYIDEVHHMNPMMQMNHMNSMNSMMETPTKLPPQEIEVVQKPTSKITDMLFSLKKPLVVLCIVFLVFNPFTLNQLGRILPSIFGAGLGPVKSQVKVLLLSMIIAMIYLLVNSFM